MSMGFPMKKILCGLIPTAVLSGGIAIGKKYYDDRLAGSDY